MSDTKILKFPHCKWWMYVWNLYYKFVTYIYFEWQNYVPKMTLHLLLHFFNAISKNLDLSNSEKCLTRTWAFSKRDFPNIDVRNTQCGIPKIILSMQFDFAWNQFERKRERTPFCEFWLWGFYVCTQFLGGLKFLKVKCIDSLHSKRSISRKIGTSITQCGKMKNLHT